MYARQDPRPSIIALVIWLVVSWVIEEGEKSGFVDGDWYVISALYVPTNDQDDRWVAFPTNSFKCVESINGLCTED